MTLEHERPPFAMLPLPVLLSGMSDRAIRLYALLDHRSGKKETAWPSRTTLAEQMACSEKSVDRAVEELEEHGLLVVERRAGVRGVNRYKLLMRSRKPSTTRDRFTGRGDKNDTSTSPKNDTQRRRSEEEQRASACPLCEGQGWLLGDGNVAQVCSCRQEAG